MAALTRGTRLFWASLVFHLVGACYGVAAYALFRLFEAEARRRASLERV